jgi:hypothetical protein
MKTERFVLMISPELLEQIGNYRHANRIGSQAEAARRLMEAGLEKEIAATGDEIGVLAPAAADHTNTPEECCNAAQR